MDDIYYDVLAQTFLNPGENTNAKIRIKPYPGQGLSEDLRIACNRKMREQHPVGTIFKLTVKVTRKEGGTPFLYCNYNWDYEVLSPEEAQEYIASRPPLQMF
jgi:hypothetical protein